MDQRVPHRSAAGIEDQLQNRLDHLLPRRPRHQCRMDMRAQLHDRVAERHTGRNDNEFAGDEGEVVVPVALALTANNGEALRQAALSGLGIITQPEILLAEDLRAGRLVALLPGYAPAARPMHLLTLADRKPPPKISSFADFVVARFGRRGSAWPRPRGS